MLIGSRKHPDACLAVVGGFVWMLCVAGCGRGDGLTQISGGVTYDGQPVKNGTISFLPPDGNGPTAAAIIADGRYSVKVAPDKKQVRIEGFKVVGQRHYVSNDPTSPMIDVQEQILPERYNVKSELTREITPPVAIYDFVLEK
jgi:hypothetical protein